MAAMSEKPFQLFGGHAALDLVNTLDNRFVASGTVELLSGYEDLLNFVQQSGLLESGQVRRLPRRAGSGAASKLMRQVRELREALASVFYSSNPTHRRPAVQIIQHFATQAGAHRRLESGASTASTGPLARWTWDFDTAGAGLPLWVLADAAQNLLTSEDSRRVRPCCRDACRWLFLDGSKNHSRRWCDMQVCGNRVKAQRFQAAHAR
jgi:predicted RNA-binding Zn ribbon-like protein